MPKCQIDRMRTANRMLVLLCALALVVTGCTDKQIFDETGLSTVVGFDLMKDGKVRGTSIMPSINPEAKQKIQVLSSIGETSKGIRDKVNLQSDKRVLGGQIRVALYNEEFAKKGIGSIVDTLYRDASLSSRVFLCVYEGSTYDLLTYPYKEQGNIGMYLYRMIDQNVRGEKIPSSTIHEFFRSYYDSGIDPHMPYVTRKGDDILLKGVALFKGDRYIDWISPKEAFLIKLIHGKFTVGSYDTSVPASVFDKKPRNSSGKEQKVQLVFDTLTSRSNIRLEQASPPKFAVHVRLRTRILEMTIPLKLEDPQMMKEMKEVLERELEKELQKIVKKTQSLDVDPAGFGIVYRANRRDLGKMDKEEWRQMYKKASFQFHVDATIIRNGVMD